MTLGGIFDKYRQIIPRWHTYPIARWLGMIVSAETETEKSIPDGNYHERILDWQEGGTLLHAADLVGNALALNFLDDKEAIRAAEHILRNKRKATGPLIEIAETFLRLSKDETFPLPEVVIPEENEKFYRVISNLKARVREYPRNPILWMDLAFYYSAIGQTKEAGKAVAVSLSLNKENRYLLRSGSRFFMHLGSPDIALHFLRQSNIGRHDPWLIAAEIAISDTAESPSKRLKVARGMIERESFERFHLSEMAGALGTIELKNGSRKKGKKLFAIALEQPTENTLAQATFLQNELGEILPRTTPVKVAHTFEAATRMKFHDQDYRGALEEAKKWFAYQPFSSRPAVGGSYIASVALRQFDDAIKIAKMGLLSSPQDIMLRNNLAFALASVGKIEEAKKSLAHIIESVPTESENNTLTATRALINFREGNIEEGRGLYRIAVDYFRRHKDLRSEAIAKFFWAREESLVKSPTAGQLEDEALAVARKVNLAELLTVPPTL